MTGYCKYCGQYVELEFDSCSAEKANDKAVLLCECPEAKQIQKNYIEESEALKRREASLLEARKAIGKIFGDSDPDREEEHHVMPEKTIGFIEEATVLVYDVVIGKITIDLPYGAKAKISRTLKGGLKIAREDKTGEAVEI